MFPIGRSAEPVCRGDRRLGWSIFDQERDLGRPRPGYFLFKTLREPGFGRAPGGNKVEPSVSKQFHAGPERFSE